MLFSRISVIPSPIQARFEFHFWIRKEERNEATQTRITGLRTPAAYKSFLTELKDLSRIQTLRQLPTKNSPRLQTLCRLSIVLYIRPNATCSKHWIAPNR